MLPTSSVHWLIFDESSVPSASPPRSRHANRHTTMSSGASEASGASHCTSRNWSTPSRAPVPTSPFANGSAAASTIPAATTKSSGTTTWRCRVGRLPSVADTPINWASDCSSPRDPPDVDGEQAEQNDRVVPGKRARERDHEGVGTRDREEREVDAPHRGQLHV